MTIREAKEQYLSVLRQRGYAAMEIARQDLLLRRCFQYLVALHHPDIPRHLASVEAEEIAALTVTAHDAVGPFLEGLRNATESVRYLNLAVLLREHPQLLPLDERAMSSFLESLGGAVSIRSIPEGLVERILHSPERALVARGRGRTVMQAFLNFCFECGWLEWNPQPGQRFSGERVLESDFLGRQGGRWAEHARAYLQHLKDERNLALGGLDYYARKLKPLVQWLDAGGSHDLQLSKLQAFIEDKRGQGVSETTLSKYLYCIRPFMDFLIRTGRTRQRDNPAFGMRIRSQPSSRRQTLSETELKRLIDSLEAAIHASAHPEEAAVAMMHFRVVRDLALILLFALCGLRLSEVARMGVEDVLADKQALRISGKGNRQARTKIREVVVVRLAWKRLGDYLRLRGHRGQRYLWISWSGRPLRPGGINKAIHARITKAGLSAAVSPHGLRATCASLYVKKGMDPYSLKTLLGHESLKTTMDHYTRLTEDQLREVWKRSNPLAGYDDE